MKIHKFFVIDWKDSYQKSVKTTGPFSVKIYKVLNVMRNLI